MKVLDLFSGIGGFSLGLERAGMETVAFCEFEPHAQAVLSKHWPETPIFDDVRKLDGKQFRGSVDVVCGGFPCQDLSSAGEQAGLDGERSSLYREMLRIISESEPRWAIFENVTGLLTGAGGLWFSQFLNDLAKIGYDAEWHCIPASELGAPHHRDRVWIVAYPKSGNDRYGKREQTTRQEFKFGESSSGDKVFTNPNSKRCEEGAKVAHHIKQQIEFMRSAETVRERFNLSEPPLCGADDGLPRWMDSSKRGKLQRGERLKRLGNAVIPQIPEAIGRAIMAHERQNNKI